MYKLDPADPNAGSNTFDRPPQGATSSSIGGIAEGHRITEELVMYYTDCRRIQDVQVVALRDRGLIMGLDMLSQCT
jgi:hypothetical protein